MFRNYFKIAWRYLLRNKIYSVINIFGLSLGLACAMLIMLYVKDEVSFDRFHKNVSNIYRIVEEDNFGGQTHKSGNTGILQGPRFQRNVPGIEHFVRVQSWSVDIKKGNDIQSQDMLRVDSSFFTVFSFPLISGDPKTCLKEPASIVLSEDEARRQFGTTDAAGRIMMIKQDTSFEPYKVTAVAKRTPQNSSIRFEMLMPFEDSPKEAQNDESWFNFMLSTFVRLEPRANVHTVEKQIQQFYDRDSKAAALAIQKRFGEVGNTRYFLQPYTDMHLNEELPATNGLEGGSKPVYSYILTGIALFVLIIACINFINLTVARSVKRAKEIGVRKVIGSDRRQLIIQFLGESFLLCTIAFVLAVILVQVVLPVFNDLSNKALALSYLFDAKLIAGYISLYLITGLLSGFYPALVLSGYKPVDTLYSRFNLGGRNYLQKSLVVLQFALASFLIVATFTIYAQFNFLTHTDLGYDDSNVVLVNKAWLSHDDAARFKTELMKDPNIVDVAAKNGGEWQTRAKVGADSIIGFAYETVDESYLPLYKIPLKEGRNFSKEFPSDSSRSVVVNESFVKEAGWKNPIGETVNFFYNNNEIYHVIGVVKDYHFASLDRKIIPQMFTMKHDNLFGMLHIKIAPNTNTASLRYIQKVFRQLFPLSPYSYTFKDQENYKSYKDVEKWKQILLFGAILTIFISCIGLFGLSVLSAEKRTKEIGIRKVLGATVNSIVTILSKDFVKLVAIALVIAIPLAYVAGSRWLETFPYHISQDWWLFATASAMVITIALITVSFQAIKAAIANPAKSLRTE